MRRSLQVAIFLPRPGMGRILALALCVYAVSCSPICAQSARQTQLVELGAPAALPAAPSPTLAGVAFGFNTANDGSRYGGQTATTFTQFGQTGKFGSQTSVAPLFSMGDSRNRRSIAGALGQFSAAPATPPSLSQYMRGNLDAHLIPPSRTGMPSYQPMFRSGQDLSDLGRPSSSALFTSPDLGNGVFLSAGTGYGGRSMPGAPAASLGNGVAGGARHSGPSLHLRLSF